MPMITRALRNVLIRQAEARIQTKQIRKAAGALIRFTKKAEGRPIPYGARENDFVLLTSLRLSEDQKAKMPEGLISRVAGEIYTRIRNGGSEKIRKEHNLKFSA